VELAPQDPGTLLLLGNLRANLGQLDEAIALLQRAVAVDPLWSRATYNLGLYLTARGRYDEAEAALRKSIELQPQASVYRAYFVVLQILQGNAAAAVDGARQMTSAPWNNFAQALAFAAHGDHKEADTALNKLIAEDADDGAFQIAAIYALRKEPDQVFKWLEHAWDTRDAGVAQLLWHPFLTSYQNDPRYVAFARKIGVMPAEKGTQVIK
jgi:serine/threonine-protein kinase